MNRRLLVPGLLFALGIGYMPARGQVTPANRTSTLKIGDTAPDFTLPDQNGKPVNLSDFRGKQNVVLAFYVLAFTGG